MEFACRFQIHGCSQIGTSTLVSERLTGAPFVADELPGEDPNSNNRSFSDPKLESLERRIDRRFSAFQGQIWISDIQISEIQVQIWMAICNGEEIGAANLKLQSSPPSYRDRRSSPTFLTADEETKGDNLALGSPSISLSVVKQIVAMPKTTAPRSEPSHLIFTEEFEADIGAAPRLSQIGAASSLPIVVDDLDDSDGYQIEVFIALIYLLQMTERLTDDLGAAADEEPKANDLAIRSRSIPFNGCRSRFCGRRIKIADDLGAAISLSSTRRPRVTISPGSFPPFAFNTDRSEIRDIEIKFADDLGASTPSLPVVAPEAGSTAGDADAASPTAGVRQASLLMLGNSSSSTAGDHQASLLMFGDFTVEEIAAVEEIDAATMTSI